MARLNIDNRVKKQRHVLELFYYSKEAKFNIKRTARMTNVSKNTVKQWLKLFPRYVRGITVVAVEYDPHDVRRGKYFYKTTLLNNIMYAELYDILSKYHFQWDKIIDLNNPANIEFKNFLNDEKLKQSLIDKGLDFDYIAYLLYQSFPVNTPSKSATTNHRMYQQKSLFAMFTIGDNLSGTHRRGRNRKHLLRFFNSRLDKYMADTLDSNSYSKKSIINLEESILKYHPDWKQKINKSRNPQRPITYYHDDIDHVSVYIDNPIKDYLYKKDLSFTSKPPINYLVEYINFKKSHVYHYQGGFSLEEIAQLYKIFNESYKRFITKDSEDYWKDTYINPQYNSVLLGNNSHDHELAALIGLYSSG